ncbi:MAG: hypothetical protein KBI47_20785 [Armatimonadetes bacterium]|jgi:hypothetical protein|nr:hypothetical protein [Armatimonadota bacterium]
MVDDKLMKDGLCDAPKIVIKARQLPAVACRLGGADCPILGKNQARAILEVLQSDPTATIRLTSDADCAPHYTMLDDEDFRRQNREAVFNRKRDLDVLQKLGLCPGDTRRARYLYELLFSRVETLCGICAFDTPGWEGCPYARDGIYEDVRSRGWQAVVHARSPEEMARAREENVDAIFHGDRIFMRPHHIMCLACWYNGGQASGLRPNDTLAEILERVRTDPKVPVTLVEGTCMACHCCDGFDPPTGRCVHSGGLIRDYKKDLDCFQMLGMYPGDTLPADEMFALIFERVGSTRDVCGYGTGEVTAEEWRICNDPAGSPGYAATRKSGVFG